MSSPTAPLVVPVLTDRPARGAAPGNPLVARTAARTVVARG
ncbi:hypothetical protein [Streptomyces sp. enrichment culture]